MHECGHGIYEQGLDATHWGTPMGNSVSLGIHESQSRMWENQVGRSRGFWRWALPHYRQAFPGARRRPQAVASEDVPVPPLYPDTPAVREALVSWVARSISISRGRIGSSRS